MNWNTRLLSALTLAACCLAGCAHVNHNLQNSTIPVSLSGNLGRDYQKVGEFNESQKKSFLLWGLVPVDDFNGAQLAMENARQADGIVNLSINTSHDPLDWLIFLLTAGIYSTMDIDVHGDLVAFRDRPTTVIVPSAAPQVIVPQSQPNVIVTPQNGTTAQ